MLKVGFSENKGAAAFGHLHAINRQKAVGVDRGRLAQAGTVEHRGPEQTVEVDDILTNEVIELGVTAR